MAYSTYEVTADGTKNLFTFTFVGVDNGYLNKSDIHVFVDTVEREYILTKDNELEITGALVPAGATVLIRRETPKDVPLVDFSDTAYMTARDMDRVSRQNLYVMHEILDGYGLTNVAVDIDMQGHKITNIFTDLTDENSVATVGALKEAIEDAESSVTEAEAAASLATSEANRAEAAVALAPDIEKLAELAAAVELVNALPDTSPADANRGMIVDESGAWVLGGTAASVNLGSGPEQVSLNKDTKPSTWYREQTIVEAADEFIVPAGDETVIVVDPDTIMPNHVANTLAGWGTVSSTNTVYSGANSTLANTFSRATADSAMLHGVTGMIRYVFETPRTVVGYRIRMSNNAGIIIGYADRLPRDWNMEVGLVDAVVPTTTVHNVAGCALTYAEYTPDYMFDEPQVDVKSIDINYTANRGSTNYLATGSIEFIFGKEASSSDAVKVLAPMTIPVADVNGGLTVYKLEEDAVIPLIGGSGGFADPELVDTTATGAAQNSTVSNFGRIDTTFTLTNGRRVTKVRVYETAARSNISVFILEASGMVMTTRAVLTGLTHNGAGWNEYVLTSPYVVPDTGTFYIGTWSTNGWYWGMANGYYIASASWSTTVGGTATALASSGYCTRTGVEYVDELTPELVWAREVDVAKCAVHGAITQGTIAALFDDNAASQALYFTDGGGVTYDYGKVSADARFKLSTYTQSAANQIEVSDDGLVWTTKFGPANWSGQTWHGSNAAPASYLSLGPCRFVRVSVSGTNWQNEYWFEFAEYSGELAEGIQYILVGPDGVRVGMTGAPASTEDVTSVISSVTGSDLWAAASVAGWVTNAADTGYIDYVVSTPTQVDVVKLTGHATQPDRTPSAFTIVADPDGQNVTLVSASGLTWAAGEQKTFPCDQSVTVQTKLRLNYTATAHGYSQEYYCGAVQLVQQVSQVDASLPTYDSATGLWSDAKVQHIIGWVDVVNGAVSQIMHGAKGVYTELPPDGTVLPNPFIYHKIMAVQDGSVRPVVNNQITTVSLSGGVVRVWRVS